MRRSPGLEVSVTVGCAMSEAPKSTHEIAQNAAEQRPQALQTALTWSPDGAPGVALVDANRGRRRKRDGMRGDARRTAEYLASRGKTPVEALHDIVAMGWIRGTNRLAEVLRVSPERAYELWERAAVHLLPYTAARFETLEFGPGGIGAAGGMALGHFLAARAMGEALAEARESRVSQTLDIRNPEAFHGANQGGTTMELPGLPPRATD
jgi:hypothetical protein